MLLAAGAPVHSRPLAGRIEPETGATARDREEFRRFDELMRGLPRSGQFTIPMELGAKTSPLDHISMREWMRQQKLDSPYLNWYVDYACRDDYGAHASDTSAWAGIHYFAAREHEERDRSLGRKATAGSSGGSCKSSQRTS